MEQPAANTLLENSAQSIAAVSVRPAVNLAGSLRLPGDKSISHRYAMLGALAEGITELENFSSGADCASTLGCLRALGCAVERQAGSVRIHGGGPALRSPAAALDCGNSGSTMRMLSGILAAQSFASVMSGDASLSRRPMQRVVTPLQKMGATITAAEGCRPPLRIQGGRLQGIEYLMPVASAQVKSAVLFAGLLAGGTTVVEEPVRTRDHSELALRAFGAQLERTRNRCSISGGQRLQPIRASIPGDISSAAFFLCAAAIFPESSLVVDDLLLNPTRAAILDVLMAMGVRITILKVEEHHGELVGTVQARHGGRLRGARIAGAQSAALIDELPVLAAIAPYTEEGVEIRDARELRVKESDRIAAMAENLRAMGAQVDIREDGWFIPGKQTLRGAEVDSFSDHRIAMASAVAALRASGELHIRDAGVVEISYPGFFPALEALLQR
ncbi:MAG TPA: 3-phosphoshikimate 1-carboxyvinyltransferase [Terriglobales bacterium]|nr:3-phosphoshikimate 1-carboxyvinyltransferase [Terriglobales bacterium]